MIVGTNNNFSDYFTGFIYSLNISVVSPDISLLVSTNNCNGCINCFISGYCIPDCNITEYYSEELSECFNCSNNCTNGCRTNKSCNLCDDYNCLSCSSYNPYACTECYQGYNLNNSLCIACNSTSYYDLISKSCIKCNHLCINCYSSTFCSSCVENAFVNSTNNCECIKGFSGIDACSQTYFSSIVTISSANIVSIIFNESLTKDLLIKDITVNINEISQTYTLTKINNFTYDIAITFIADIKQGDLLNIVFVSNILSYQYYLLETQFLSINLFPYSYSNLVAEVALLKNYAQIGMAIGLSAAFGTSVIMVDPTSFFNFLNNAEIYSYIIIYQTDIDVILVDFLNALQVNSYIPCVFNFIIKSEDGIQLNGKLNDFGYSNNLIMLNSGPNLMIFGFLLTLIPIFTCLKMFENKWIKAVTVKVC